MLFLGTPHQGSHSATYASVLSRIANIFVIGGQLSRVTGRLRSSLVKSLEENAEGLFNIAEDFRVHTATLAITSFIEQKNMRGLNERVRRFAITRETANRFVGRLWTRRVVTWERRQNDACQCQVATTERSASMRQERVTTTHY